MRYVLYLVVILKADTARNPLSDIIEVLYLVVILQADTAGAFRFCSNKIVLVVFLQADTASVILSHSTCCIL